MAAPTPLRRRIGSVLAAGAAVLVSAGWWVAIVELIPAGSRPYIGGSQANSVLELIFAYNGFGRLTGQETGSVGVRPVAAGVQPARPDCSTRSSRPVGRGGSTTSREIAAWVQAHFTAKAVGTTTLYDLTQPAG